MLHRKSREANRGVIFNLHDPRAQGRTALISCSVIESIINWLTGGLFYTSFLMVNDIDIVNVGIINFIPPIATCFVIFTPSLLERIPKRRWILMAAKLLFHVFNILCITIMPTYVKDPAARIGLIILFTLLANIVNTLCASGYMTWHANFLEPHVRSEFFGIQQVLNNFIGFGVALVSSLIADSLAGSEHQVTILYVLRYAAFALAILDTVLLTLPKEFPYEKSAGKTRLSDIFTKPIRNKPFARTMAVVFLYTFFGAVPNSVLNYYILNSVGMSYTFFYVINMIYPVIVMLLMKPSKKLIERFGWFKTYAAAEFLHLPTNLLYAFVSATTYIWAFPVVRIIQHVLGVPLNICRSNMPYVNLPQEDQTNYMAFFNVAGHLASFLGMMCGTWFVAAFPDMSFKLLGVDFINVQVLLFVAALGNGIVPLLVKKWMPMLAKNVQ